MEGLSVSQTEGLTGWEIRGCEEVGSCNRAIKKEVEASKSGKEIDALNWERMSRPNKGIGH